MEKRFDDLVNFTNIDKEDFIGTWGEEAMGTDNVGNPMRISLENKQYPVKAGETLKNVLRFKAEAFAQHLAERMLIAKGKDFGDTNPEKKVLIDQMITDVEAGGSTSLKEDVEKKEEEFAGINEENLKQELKEKKTKK